jgi:2-polyprenyl-6-methoxyphenol hydroxylase-like FAD-dependent oxidoreductase
MEPNKQTFPLNISIVGAGIGGLAASLGLRREGHEVQVFEKSKFANEVGAAVVLPINVYGLLKRLGVNTEEHGSNTEDIRSFYSLKGDLIFENDLTGYGGAARLIHRVDLHEALKEAAMGQGVKIHLSSPVELVDVERASVTLSNGQVIVADAVIGADGLNSVARKSIVPGAPSPAPFHLSMFRMLIPCSKLAASPETTRYVNPPGKMTIFASNDGRRVVNYPCRSNTIMNVAVVYPSCFAKPYEDDREMKQHMLEIFSDFHSSSHALLANAEEFGTWTLYDLPALETWSRGRATLMGDAAHPVLPYAAQGAAQALEDAAALAVLLERGTTASQVPDRLKLYYNTRHERAEWVQDFARGADQSTPQNPDVPPKINPVEFFEAVHNHDAWVFAEERLQEHLKYR